MARMISADDALFLLREECSGLKLTEYDTDQCITGLTHLMQNAPAMIEPATGRKFFALDSISGFFNNWVKWLESRDASLLMRRRGMRDREVDVIEFAESDEFLGLKGSLFPKVKEALWEIWHSKTERYSYALLTGSTGIGKSFILEICQAMALRRMLNYYDPQAELGLAPGTSLYFVFQSGNQRRAINILYRPFRSRLNKSPYFTKVMPFQKNVTSEMYFPDSHVYVTPFSGSDDAVLGITVVNAGITELNRMAYVQSSRRSSVQSRKDESRVYDQALAIFIAVRNRIVGRTMQLGGKIWGMVILDAAHEHDDDFTARQLKEAAAEVDGSRSTFVYNYKQWEVRPPHNFCGETFLVEVGDERTQSRILLDGAQAVNVERVMEVPVEYKNVFEQDLDVALRDFAAVTVNVETPAIPYKENIYWAFEEFERITGGMQLFNFDVRDVNKYLSSPMDFSVFDELINKTYIEKILIQQDLRLAGHLDPAISHCDAGYAIGHIHSWMPSPEATVWDHRRRAFIKQEQGKKPIFMIDGIVALSAQRGDEINLLVLQYLIQYLYERVGLCFQSVDSWQSAQMLAAWRLLNDLATGTVSTEASLEPYTELKLAYRDKRIIAPYHSQYADEITHLQFNGSKFIKLEEKSKDTADAVAGCIYLLGHHLAAQELNVISRRPRPLSEQRHIPRPRRRPTRRRQYVR